MYAIERTRIIRQYLHENGRASVHSLSELLGVSEVTVRRDLERLEVEGLLTRTHGGAMLNSAESIPVAITRIDLSRDEIREIALQGVRMVDDGEIVMLTNGAICTGIAEGLESRSNLTVLTNDIAIAGQMTVQQANRVVLLGGDLDIQERCVYGSMAVDNLRRFFVQRLFIEVDGINEDFQLSVNSQSKADLIRAAMEVSTETIVTCLPENFSHNSFFRLGPVSLADRVITGTDIDESYKTGIFNLGVPLYTPVTPFEGST